MERIFLIADDNCMAGVISALISDYIFNFIAENIGRFTLALVAPLDSKQNNGCQLMTLSLGLYSNSSAGVRDSIIRIGLNLQDSDNDNKKFRVRRV
jgi:hypothetical protein